ncbi:MAG TPA: hypothetical protein VFP65_14560 [Anaeromyxobacteraceae bacterium]|nr:hypothetical protein [Anaeromyxobacteraceae bacterium]
MRILAAVSMVMAVALGACASTSTQTKGAPPAAASEAPAKAQSCVRDLDCGAGEICYQNVCHR